MESSKRKFTNFYDGLSDPNPFFTVTDYTVYINKFKVYNNKFKIVYFMFYLIYI